MHMDVKLQLLAPLSRLLGLYFRGLLFCAWLFSFKPLDTLRAGYASWQEII